MSASILIVDDEPNIRRMLGSLLRAEGYHPREAANARAALAEVQGEEPDAVLMDLYMDGESGLDALPRLREAAPHLPVIMMSGRASLADAVKATRLGAFHFIEKPLTPEAVLLTLGSALELRKSRELNQALREELGDADEMVGRSPAVEKVREMIARIAPTDARVLITGESGTGKEVAASAIHRLSQRVSGPYIKLNCAAIPRDLVESEMFGHERGAFTGATDRRRGRFELAHGGTLFLDEVGDLSMEAQAKLLRALEVGEIERVGGSGPIAVDVRVLTATNKDLRAEVAAGRFREDLFFRLHVIPLHLAPLRERPGDVPLLVEHFVRRNQRRHGLRPPRISPAGMEALARHPWPGNIRELANILERISILHAGTEVGAAEIRAVLAADGPLPVEAAAAPAAAYRDDDDRTLSERLDEYERQLLIGALDYADGNVAEAARKLKTDRANLYRRMRRLDVVR
jgi:two-component system nitrogen regulation response regulator NtrX